MRHAFDELTPYPSCVFTTACVQNGSTINNDLFPLSENGGGYFRKKNICQKFDGVKRYLWRSRKLDDKYKTKKYRTLVRA